MQDLLPQPWDFGDAIGFFFPKILFALVCGGLVGLERQLKHKSAGMKTNMLICLGATVYTGISVLMWSSFQAKGVIGDPARVAAQIVSGIGFLGGGAIIQSRGTVVGLTTAANIWVVAALGICIGVGEGWLALSLAIVIVTTLRVTSVFETRVLGRRHSYALTIVVDATAGNTRQMLMDLLDKNELDLEDLQIVSEDGKSAISLHYRGVASDQKRFLFDLWSISGITEIRQS